MFVLRLLVYACVVNMSATQSTSLLMQPSVVMPNKTSASQRASKSLAWNSAVVLHTSAHTADSLRSSSFSVTPSTSFRETPEVSSTLIDHIKSTSITPVVVTAKNPEILNPFLTDLLKFQINGSLKEEHYTVELNEAAAGNYSQLSATLQTQLNEVFDESFVASYVQKIDNNSPSVNVEAVLYFKITSNTKADLILANLTQLKDKFVVVRIKEICTKNTCGGVSRGACAERLVGAAVCKCNRGFRGDRCKNAFPVDSNAYGAWSIWTACSRTCGGGKRKKFRWCTPVPVNNGTCKAGPNPHIVNETCNDELCEREHEDDDYYLIAYICGGIFIAIIILVVAFCCTYQNTAAANKQNTEIMLLRHRLKQLEDKSLIRIPHPASGKPFSPATRNGKEKYIAGQKMKSKQRLDDATDNSHLNSRPVTKWVRDGNPPNNGFDNKAYQRHEDDELSDGEEIYRQQIQKFLEHAPEIRYSTATDAVNKHRASVRSSGKKMATSSPLPKDKPIPAARVTPMDINKKIIERGPSRFKLVMI